MKKYEIKIKAPAYTTVVVEAPDEATAVAYLKENVDYYSYSDKMEIDDMDGQVDAGQYSHKDAHTPGEWWGVERVDHDADAEFTVDTEWLKDNGYRVETVITKIKEA